MSPFFAANVIFVEDRSSELNDIMPNENSGFQPLKFFTTEGGMCPYAARTLIAITELGLPFETIHVPMRPKPDW